MSELSDASEVLVLDWLLGVGNPTRPAGQFLAITTGSILDAHTGSNLGGGTEIAVGGYARQATAFNGGSSPGGSADNSALESFTATGANFGTILDFAICDAVTVGGCLCFSPLTNSRIVNDGETLEFAAGAIVVNAA